MCEEGEEELLLSVGEGGCEDGLVVGEWCCVGGGDGVEEWLEYVEEEFAEEDEGYVDVGEGDGEAD